MTETIAPPDRPQTVTRKDRMAALDNLIRANAAMTGRELSNLSGYERGYCLLRRRQILGLTPEPSKSRGAQAANALRRTAKPAPVADAPAPWWSLVV